MGGRGAASGRAVLAVAGGLVLDLAFPGTGWWPLAPVAVAALLLAVRGVGWRGGAVLGLLFGLAFFVPHVSWSGVYVGALPWLALAGLEAVFVAALGAVLPLAWRAPGGVLGTTAATAGLWVAQEALRARIPFGGFPWGRLAFSQADSPAVALAALGGAPLVSAAVAAGGALLAVALTLVAGSSRTGAGAPRASALARPAAAVLGAVAVIAAGAVVPLPTAAERGTAVVAAVQGDVPAAGLDFNAERRAVLDNHVEGTLAVAEAAEAGELPAPDLVLWPENASDVDPLRDADARRQVQRAADAVDAPVVVGAVLRPDDRLRNASIVWGPTSGQGAPPGPGDTYVKRQLAPFGEYVPHRAFFRRITSQVDLVARDFAPGEEVAVLPAGPAAVGPVICFEVAYDGVVRDVVRAGADLLVVQTNNATFGFTDESTQQLAMSRLRAVETGRAVVHVSTVGVSALIAPDGSTGPRTGLFEPAQLVEAMPLRTTQTVATRVGPLPEAVLAGLGLALAAVALVRGRGARRPASVDRGAAPLAASPVPAAAPGVPARSGR